MSKGYISETEERKGSDGIKSRSTTRKSSDVGEECLKERVKSWGHYR